MAQLPPLMDPTDAVDRLPQPYRMLDKFLAGLVESALHICDLRQQERDISTSMFVEQELLPHGVLEQHVACQTWAPATDNTEGADASPSVVCVDSEGRLASWTMRLDGQAEWQQWQNAPVVTALDTCCNPLKGGMLVAAAEPGAADSGASVVSLFSLTTGTTSSDSAANGDVNGSGVSSSGSTGPQQLIAKAAMTDAVKHLRFSPDSRILAVSAPSGNLTMFHVPLGLCNQSSAASTSGVPTAVLQVALQVTAAAVAEQVGEASLCRTPQCSWQLTYSATDGTGEVTVTGVYVWWPGHSHLLLYRLPAAASAIPSPAAAHTPAGIWTLPYGIECGASTSDGRLLALGLANGSVVLWDDWLGGHRAVLPRLPSPPSCLAFVGGRGDCLLSATQAGKLYTSDLRSNKPTQTLWALPQLLSVQEMLFPYRGSSLALLLCSSAVPAAPAPGLPAWARTGALPEVSVVGMGPPRLLLVDVEAGSMVAELQAPPGCCFYTSASKEVDGSGAQARLMLAQDGSTLVVGAYKLPPSAAPAVTSRTQHISGPISWPSLRDRQPSTAPGGNTTAAAQPAVPAFEEPAAVPVPEAEAPGSLEQGEDSAADGSAAGPTQLLVFKFAQMGAQLGQAPASISTQQGARGSTVATMGSTSFGSAQQESAGDETAAALARIAARLGASQRRQRERRVKAGLEQLLQQLAAEASSANPPLLLAR